MKTLLFSLVLALPAFAQDAKPEEKPAPEASKPELPALPAPEDESNLLKGQPGGRLKPAPSVLPDDVPPPAKRSTVQQRTGTTLKPPTTSADLDFRIRYRQARNRSAADPAVHRWRLVLTNRFEKKKQPE